MFNNNNIQEAIGTEQEYNYYGKTYTGVVKSVREITTNRDTFSVIIGEHSIVCDYKGGGVKYNDFSTAFVKCEDCAETWKAFDVIKGMFPADFMKGIKATVRCS